MAVTKISLGRQTDLNANSGVITNVAAPIASTDAANRAYVEAAIDEIASGAGQIFNRIDTSGDIRVAADGSLRITN